MLWLVQEKEDTAIVDNGGNNTNPSDNQSDKSSNGNNSGTSDNQSDIVSTEKTYVFDVDSNDKVMYALFSKKDDAHYVYFEDHEELTQFVSDGNKATAPTGLYAFQKEVEGWYLDSGLTDKFDFDTPITEDKVLYVKWKASDITKKYLCQLKDDFTTVKKISGDGLHNCTVIGDKCLIKGKINKWKIKNINDKTHILFGINRSDIDLNGQENYKSGYITNLDNMNKHNLGVYTPIFNHKIKPNDIIGIVVDLEKGKLSYSINDDDFGVFCDNINLNVNYVPFIEMINVGSEITLIQ